MSTRLMLDTNAVSALVKGQANALSASLNGRLFCISVITEAELRFGLVRRVINADLRRIVENFLVCVDIRPWTSDSAQRYGPLRKELEALGKPLAPMDLLIAAHALTENCTLVSADRAFTQVPGLCLLDWSANSAPVTATTPAQHERDKLTRAGVTSGDVEEAGTQARKLVRHPTQKIKPVKTRQQKSGKKPR